MRISDWSSDVCSSDLARWRVHQRRADCAGSTRRLASRQIEDPPRKLFPRHCLDETQGTLPGRQRQESPQQGCEEKAISTERASSKAMPTSKAVRAGLINGSRAGRTEALRVGKEWWSRGRCGGSA